VRRDRTPSLRLLDQQGDLPRDDLSVGVTLDAH
jgi:hypothetical protein